MAPPPHTSGPSECYDCILQHFRTDNDNRWHLHKCCTFLHNFFFFLQCKEWKLWLRTFWKYWNVKNIYWYNKKMSKYIRTVLFLENCKCSSSFLYFHSAASYCAYQMLCKTLLLAFLRRSIYQST